jgi:penicillin amidase
MDSLGFWGLSFVCAAGAVLAAASCASDRAPAMMSDGGGGEAGSTEVTGPLGVRPDLPVDARLAVAHLAAPADVVRDSYGRPHIYAASAADALRVEGYLVAVDRTMQLDYFRRLSEGRLAEVLGDLDPGTIDIDIVFRTIGLARVAQAQYTAMAADSRALLDAYADGITQVFQKIRSGEIALPAGLAAYPTAALGDWSAVDSLAVARLQAYLLSYSGDTDLGTQAMFSASRAVFTAGDPDPAIRKRAGIERELSRFAPVDPATTTTGYPAQVTAAQLRTPTARARRAAVAAQPLADLSTMRGYLAAMARVRELLAPKGFGSNGWAIAGSRSATGHALIASDPHLALNGPAIFWPVSIDVVPASGTTTTARRFDVGGIAFPGIPGIVLGHNEQIGWGATVAAYDVTDVYSETVSADGSAVMWRGSAVPLETVDEVIQIHGSAPYTYHVEIVPHHGPVHPNITAGHTVAPPTAATGAFSVRWTGLEATAEIPALLALMQAGSVDEAQAALDQYGVGAQNWIIGDTAGHILWTSHANIPLRDRNAFTWDAATYTGQLPCLVLPGGGSAEWTGVLPGRLVPWAKDPTAGYLANANNDPIGDTLDNDPSNGTLRDGTPMFLACAYDIGLREGRITSLLQTQAGAFSIGDMQAMQADARSALGAAMTPALLDAIGRAEAERAHPGSHPDLTAVVHDAAYDPARIAAMRDLIASWGANAGYQAASGIDPDTGQPKPAAGADAAEVAASQATLVFNTWLVRFQARVLDDELARLGQTLDRGTRIRTLTHLMTADPTTLGTYDPATGDSAIWDDLATPTVIESRYERMVRSLLDALGALDRLAGPDLASYRWGALHRVRMAAILPVFPAMAIPPAGDTQFPNGFPRHGDSFGVDLSDFPFPALNQDPSFSYTGGEGPVQRFVVDLDPAGPRAFNALPGGAVWDPASPHFRDEAELWRKNQVHPVPFQLADVIAAKESRTVATAP